MNSSKSLPEPFSARSAAESPGSIETEGSLGVGEAFNQAGPEKFCWCGSAKRVGSASANISDLPFPRSVSAGPLAFFCAWKRLRSPSQKIRASCEVNTTKTHPNHWPLDQDSGSEFMENCNRVQSRW